MNSSSQFLVPHTREMQFDSLDDRITHLTEIFNFDGSNFRLSNSVQITAPKFSSVNESYLLLEFVETQVGNQYKILSAPRRSLQKNKVLTFGHRNFCIDYSQINRNSDLETSSAFVEFMFSLLSNPRDNSTLQHDYRVGEGTRMLLELAIKYGDPELSDILIKKDPSQIELYLDLAQMAGFAHDIGKFLIPTEILCSPNDLNCEEWVVMKKHTDLGYLITTSPDPSNPENRIFIPGLEMIASVARHHHERYDGRGYLGLGGKAIPIISRIVSVVDVFDALISSRPYKPEYTYECALEMMFDGKSDEGGKIFPDGFFGPFLSYLLRRPDIRSEFISQYRDMAESMNLYLNSAQQAFRSLH